MPDFESPVALADDALNALLRLARSSREITDPREAYRVLSSLSWSMTPLSRALDQLTTFYEGPGRETAILDGDKTAGADAAAKIAAEVRAAADKVHAAGVDLDRAWGLDSTVGYDLAPPQQATPQAVVDSAVTNPALGDGPRELAPPASFGTNASGRGDAGRSGVSL